MNRKVPPLLATASPRLLTREVLLGLACTSTSGAAVLFYALGPVPMSFSVPFVVLPTSALLVAAILLRRGRWERLHRFSRLLVLGGGSGLLATFAYDLVRPLLVRAFGLGFDPYRAISIFGELITGRPAGDAVALAAGWAYHFWNGISFGMMFALIRPRGGVLPAVVWAMTLQALMMAAYPRFLQVRLEDPGFLLTGIIGHAFWGVVLGLAVRRWSADRV